jgi:glycosyltransferase involved in cell wall biosynthesis
MVSKNIYPIISICIPTRNRAAFLEENLSNLIKIIDQFNLEEKIEIIISDNGSTDNTTQVLNNVIEKKYIKILKHPNNIGFSGNVLSMLKKATGKYVWMLGDDDKLDKDAFIEIIKIVSRKDCPDIIVGKIKMKYSELIISHPIKDKFIMDLGVKSKKNPRMFKYLGWFSVILIKKLLIDYAINYLESNNQTDIKSDWIHLLLIGIYLDQKPIRVKCYDKITVIYNEGNWYFPPETYLRAQIESIIHMHKTLEKLGCINASSFVLNIFNPIRIIGHLIIWKAFDINQNNYFFYLRNILKRIPDKLLKIKLLAAGLALMLPKNILKYLVCIGKLTKLRGAINYCIYSNRIYLSRHGYSDIEIFIRNIDS